MDDLEDFRESSCCLGRIGEALCRRSGERDRAGFGTGS